MSTNTEDKQSPFVVIGHERFCKYCGNTIDKYHHYCNCPDSLKLQEINRKVIALEIERIKLINSAPPARFTAETRLVPLKSEGNTYQIICSPDTDEDEPPVNV